MTIEGHVVLSTKTYEEGFSGISADGTIVFANENLIDTKTRQLKWSLPRAKRTIKNKTYAELDKIFLAVSRDYALLHHSGGGSWLYNIPLRNQILSLSGHYYCRPSLTNNRFAWLGRDKLTVYENKTGREIWSLSSPKLKNHIAQLSITNNDKYLFIGGLTKIMFYSMEDGREMWELPILINSNFTVNQGYGKNKFKYYSITDTGELVLLGHEKTVKLYRAY